jgi:DNA recombination protein RmuC
MDAYYISYLILGGLFIAAVSPFSFRSHNLEVQLKQQEKRIGKDKETITNLEGTVKGSVEQISQLQSNALVLDEKLKGERENLEMLKAQFEEQKKSLKDEFTVLSENILKKREDSLNEKNTIGVSALLKPLEDRIAGFQKRVNEVHEGTIRGNKDIEAEIKKVMEVGIRMRDDASNLTQALKGNSQQRGAWGEAQLERTLEMSGLIENAHYEKQSSFKDQAGKRKQTDYLIKLPDKKHIVIDSKVSLNAYHNAVAADTDQERSYAMDEHVKSVKAHINDLASKDYTSLIGVHSPNFVLMFMPIESGYIEALKHDLELFSYGYSKNIILVSHTTSIPILRTVANLWVLDKSNNEARELGDAAGAIYNAVCTVSERFLKLGDTLNTASTHFDSVRKALAGKQGLKGKVEKFEKISSNITKEMPPLEARNIEFDVSLLEIEPISADNLTSSLEDSASQQPTLTDVTREEDT